MSDALLTVKNLKKYFKTPKGQLHAVDNVSFEIGRKKTLGIVGESGCGKSTLGRTILRLTEPSSGEIIFDGTDIVSLSREQMRVQRQKMQMIFQDPYSSLDPRKTVSQTIREPLLLNKMCTSKVEANERVSEIMETVGLAANLANTYPHELDGGRRQRIGIARALIMSPDFIVCDEPVSALDVSIQAQILNLMESLQDRMGLTYIFITHDLSVVNYFANEIAVMYLGQMVEKAPSEMLFDNPLHPYTQALLSAIPVPSIRNRKKRIILKGELVSPVNPKPVCRFAERCIYAGERCKCEEPKLLEVEPGHFVSCFFPGGDRSR